MGPRARRLALMALLGLVAANAVARPDQDRPQLVPDEPEVDAPFARPPRQATVGHDTTWIADWTFDAPGGGCTPSGWTAYDFHFRNAGNNDWSTGSQYAGLGGVINNSAAILRHHDLCWARDGYGNNWDYSIVLRYQDPPGAGTFATLAFDKSSDSEPGYDFVSVEADSAGASEARFNFCANPSGAAESYRQQILSTTGYDPGSHVGPVNLPEYGPGLHEVYIRFNSDAGYSDQDGMYSSGNHLGLVVDNIVVTGPLAYVENFEGSLGANVQLLNTAANVPFCAAPWARLVVHPTDNDKCTEDNTCAWIASDPARPALFPDMAFGPGQAIVHNWIDDIVVSPWVALGPTAKATVFSLRRFGGNIFTNGYIVQGHHLRSLRRVDNTDSPQPGDSIDCVSTWARMSSFNTLGTFAWTNKFDDLAQYYDPSATQIQVAFRIADGQALFGYPPPTTLNPGPGPYIDRVRLGRLGLPGPGMGAVDPSYQAQDAFPTALAASPSVYLPDGSNRFGACAFSGSRLVGSCCGNRPVPGDSIIVYASDSNGTGMAGVRFYGAIVSGPHAGKAPPPYSVSQSGFFTVDAAKVGAFNSGYWTVDLDDTYLRGGDVLQYVWIAEDNAGRHTSLPAGLFAPPESIAQAELETGGLYEVNALPVIDWDPAYLARIAADNHGDLDPTETEIAQSRQANCILYYEKVNTARRSGAANRTTFMYTLDALGYRGKYDVYDTQGYSSASSALATRANVGQCAGYALIIQDDGRSSLLPNVPTASQGFTAFDQAQWYRDYLAQGATSLAGRATLWLLGESTAIENPSNPLFATDMGLAGVVGDQGIAVNPEIAGTGSFTWATGEVTSFAGDACMLQGGCPFVRAYDGASASGTAVVTHRYQAGPNSGPGAVVMNRNVAQKWNTVWMGFGWFDVRDGTMTSLPSAPSFALASKILTGALADSCLAPLDPTGAGDPISLAAPRSTALLPNVPNPFNPTTQIPFDLAAPGHVVLSVYDGAGRWVCTLVDAQRAPGHYSTLWNGLTAAGVPAPSGVYFSRLATPTAVVSRKMILVR